MPKSNFINELVKNENQIGAIAPSSKYLAQKMLAKIDFSTDLNIVELGPGTGVFTSKLLKRMSPNSKLLSLELNPYFASKIRKSVQDSRFQIRCDSAENINTVLKQTQFLKVDYIISSLPLAVLPIRLKLRIINECKLALGTEGGFIQFQYSLNAKDLLYKKFSSVDITFTPLNLPPAFVYHCSF